MASSHDNAIYESLFFTNKQYKMRKILFLSITLLATVSLLAQDTYIKYDPSYFDKMEYHITDKGNNISYLAYRLNKSATEKIFFETGIENTEVKSKLPAKLTLPSDVNFDQGDVRSR